jgi:hypothetical protein
MLTILLISSADTELLAARASGASYRTANPARLDPDAAPDLAAPAAGRPPGLDALRDLEASED